MKHLLTFLCLIASAPAANVTITWDHPDAANVDSYNVYTRVMVQPGQSETPYTIRNTPAAPFTLSNLVAGVTYDIAVSALRLGVESDLSAPLFRYTSPVVTNTAPPVRLATPAAVNLLGLLPAGPGRFSLGVQWDAVNDTNRTGYLIRWGSTPAKTNQVRQTISTSAQFQGLVNGVSYYFSVTATGDGSPPDSLPSADYIFRHDFSAPGNVKQYVVSVTGPPALPAGGMAMRRLQPALSQPIEFAPEPGPTAEGALLPPVHPVDDQPRLGLPSDFHLRHPDGRTFVFILPPDQQLVLDGTNAYVRFTTR